jgi:hypothetical protein
MRRMTAAALFGAAILTGALAGAQTPQPFPRPGGAPPPQTPRPAAPPPAQPGPPVQPAPRATAQPAAPTSETLGIALYPTAQFLASYDARQGQRYYLFGTTAAYAEVVGYYRTQLDQRGDQVYEAPGTHMFSGGRLGRYDSDTMAVPPSVTVKDWTGGGSRGYPHPTPGAEPARFPTIIMIVPPPAGTPAR